MPEGIQVRGPHQYRVQIRRNGIYQSRTFETLREAREWRRVTDGKVSGGEFVDTRAARSTTLAQACDWMLEGSRAGTNPNAKNVRAKLRYWKTTTLANWSITAIHDWDLIEWRRQVLDEDNVEDGDLVGPDAECGPQSVIHRLNALSKLVQTWSRAQRVPLENPVKPGVRPPKPDGRDRRLLDGEEERLLASAAGSSRSWLPAAIIIAIETCIRQSELATLTWGRVKLDVEYPYIDLPKTKNDRPRRVPLSMRAVAAFRSLLPAENCPVLGSVPVLPVETGRGIAHAFRDAIADRDFPGLRWHDLRHEGISRLFELTDLRDHEIMAITGHLTPAMLARYTHLRADRLGARLPGGPLNRR
ncbi:MAG TPA: site-specific integrase [Alphaproteobacteria bacterium]|nr:site-specific integrase [Alphaproteobacteria bacterium]